MDLQIHGSQHRRGQADSDKTRPTISEVDDMVICVKMNYVLGDGTRQTEKNKIVARTNEGRNKR